MFLYDQDEEEDSKKENNIDNNSNSEAINKQSQGLNSNSQLGSYQETSQNGQQERTQNRRYNGHNRKSNRIGTGTIQQNDNNSYSRHSLKLINNDINNLNSINNFSSNQLGIDNQTQQQSNASIIQSSEVLNFEQKKKYSIQQQQSQITDKEMENLSKIVKGNGYQLDKQNKDIIFEPGQKHLNSKNDDLPVLQKMDARFQVQQQQIQQNNINIMPNQGNQSPKQIIFSDDDEDDEEDYKNKEHNMNNIIQKKKSSVDEEDEHISPEKFSEDDDNDEEDQEDDQTDKQQKQKMGEQLEQKAKEEEEKENKNNCNLILNTQISENTEQKDENIKSQQSNENKEEEKKEEEPQTQQLENNSQITPLRRPKRDFKLFTKDLLRLGNDNAMREFLTTPIVKGYTMQCHVRRERSGMNWFNPKFHLYLSDGNVLLLSAKKMSGNKSPNYLIMQQNMENVERSDDFKKNNVRYIGKLRGNFMGKQFIVYDTGCKPKFTKDDMLMRRELAQINYENGIMDGAVPTKMKCFIPDIDMITHELKQEFFNKESISERLKQKTFQNLRFFYTKPPFYNEKEKTYFLDFGPRIQKQSIKNYQLIDEVDDKLIYLMSGRSDQEDKFVLDFTFPFSPLQAFGICIAGLTYKA